MRYITYGRTILSNWDWYTCTWHHCRANKPEYPTIFNFDLDICEELTESDVKTYLELEENKENNYELDLVSFLTY